MVKKDKIKIHVREVILKTPDQMKRGKHLSKYNYHPQKGKCPEVSVLHLRNKKEIGEWCIQNLGIGRFRLSGYTTARTPTGCKPKSLCEVIVKRRGEVLDAEVIILKSKGKYSRAKGIVNYWFWGKGVEEIEKEIYMSNIR